MGKRIEGEVGRCGERLRGKKLAGMKRDSGMIVVCERDLINSVSGKIARNRRRRTSSQTGEDEA